MGLVLAVLGFAAVPAQASPQILALLSTDGAVPLDCAGALCTAELSAFCLEEMRATPEPGTRYRAAAGSGVVLVVTGSDGQLREIEGTAHATFASLRDMTAVRVVVNRRDLGDAARVSIRAGASAALLPEISPRHGAAHSDAEVAHATGPLRATAAAIVDASAGAEIARGLSRALNFVASGDEAAALRLGGAAAPIVRACTARLAEHAARRRDVVGIYGYWTGRGIVGTPTIRTCLEGAHGTLMTGLNRRFWRSESGPPAASPPAPHM
jgi:hypothetical protein